MRGAAKAARLRTLSMAEAVRAGTHLDAADYQTWADQVFGVDRRLPPEALNGLLRRAGNEIETIRMADALKRMH